MEYDNLDKKEEKPKLCDSLWSINEEKTTENVIQIKNTTENQKNLANLKRNIKYLAKK